MKTNKTQEQTGLLFNNKQLFNSENEIKFFSEGVELIIVNKKKYKIYCKKDMLQVIFVDCCGLLLLNGEEKINLIKEHLKKLITNYLTKSKFISESELENRINEASLKYKTFNYKMITKKILFGENSNLTKNEKQSIYAKKVGEEQSKLIISKLKENYLPGIKKIELVKKSGISLSSVKKYWNQIKGDLTDINTESIIDTKIQKEELKSTPELIFKNKIESNSEINKKNEEIEKKLALFKINNGELSTSEKDNYVKEEKNDDEDGFDEWNFESDDPYKY